MNGRLLACTLVLSITSQLNAGQRISGPDKVEVTPPGKALPAGSLTLGVQVSENLWSGYADSVAPFYQIGNALFFFNGRSAVDDNSQFVSSAGLGMRYLIPDSEVIIGGNVYYDRVESQYGNDYDQLGFGVEILSRWVDARFNYYAPEDGKNVVASRDIERRSLNEETVNIRETRTVFGPGGVIVPLSIDRSFDLRQERRETSRFQRFEAPLEGWNAELGFLVPGLDHYLETRLFAGFYRYGNPFGSDYKGFKGRLEARLLPGLIADLEWWDDAALMGGHWTGGFRASVPFSFGNLFTGKNPFEGASESFRPRPRVFTDRMTEMVVRSHRIKTTTSSFIPVRSATRTETTVRLSNSLNFLPLESIDDPGVSAAVEFSINTGVLRINQTTTVTDVEGL